MAHFAELDINNKVLKVVKACNQDIANNGGEQSVQAAEHFKTVCPLSENGVKFVQTSYNKNFRKNFAGVGMTYDENRNAFIPPKPYNSWVLNEDTCNWEAPITLPNLAYGDGSFYYTPIWNESEITWYGIADNNNIFKWEVSLNSWISTGN
jgi:hypothetical protein